MSVTITKENIRSYRSGSHPSIKDVKWRAGKLRACILHNFPNLESLNCASNKLTTLAGIEVCEKLRILHCHDNRLTSLAGIEECYHLRKLYCCSNKLTDLAELEGCLQLRELYCANNRLRSLEGLHNCTRLVRLDCPGNKLKTLTGVENSQYLSRINCDDNRLVTVDHLNKLSFLACVSCKGNPPINWVAVYQKWRWRDSNSNTDAVINSDLSDHAVEILFMCIDYDVHHQSSFGFGRPWFYELLEHAWNRATKSKQLPELLHCIEDLMLSERSFESQHASLLSVLVEMYEESKEDV